MASVPVLETIKNRGKLLMYFIMKRLSLLLINSDVAWDLYRNLQKLRFLTEMLRRGSRMYFRGGPNSPVIFSHYGVIEGGS